MKKYLLGIALCFATVGAGANEAKLPKIELPTSQEVLQRGAETVATVCLSCHNLKYIKYSDLSALGFNKEKLGALSVGHGLDDSLMSPMSAEATKQAFGITPPDLSMMAKARVGGPHYVYAFVTGFYTNDKGKTDNHVFPGAKMPDVLGAASAKGEERTAIEYKAKEVAAFLEWAGDPKAQERRGLGRYVIAYLIVLTILLYLVKLRTWARLKEHHKRKHA